MTMRITYTKTCMIMTLIHIVRHTHTDTALTHDTTTSQHDRKHIDAHDATLITHPHNIDACSATHTTPDRQSDSQI